MQSRSTAKYQTTGKDRMAEYLYNCAADQQILLHLCPIVPWGLLFPIANMTFRNHVFALFGSMSG